MQYVVDISKYFADIDLLGEKIKEVKPDCIVAIMRSGLIPGTVLSNKLHIPLFVISQIDSIPDKFKTIILLDDKTYTGKTLRLNRHKFGIDKKVYDAVIYVEHDYFPSIYVEDLKAQYKMFYEL